MRYILFSGLFAVLLASSAFCQDGNPDVDVILRADISNKRFILSIKNNDSDDVLLEFRSGVEWFYSIEIWRLRVGHLLDHKVLYEAEENGAFLGPGSDIVVSKGESKQFGVNWSDLATNELSQAEIEDWFVQAEQFAIYKVRAGIAFRLRSEPNRWRNIASPLIPLKAESNE